MSEPKSARRAIKPIMLPYARHILVCTGESCAVEGEGLRLYRRLNQLLGDLSDNNHPERVKKGKVECLGVCTLGPIVVVYPDGIWYSQVNEALLTRIVEEHLRQGKPVWEHVFYSLTARPAGS